MKLTYVYKKNNNHRVQWKLDTTKYLAQQTTLSGPSDINSPFPALFINVTKYITNKVSWSQ